MDSPSVKTLVVDDDISLLAVMEDSLRMCPGLELRATPSGGEALAILNREPFDLVIADYELHDPAVNGIKILKLAQERNRSSLGILITAFASLEVSIEAIHVGAYDFLSKPFQLDELQLTIRNAAERLRLTRENDALRGEVGSLTRSIRQLAGEHASLMNEIKVLADRPPLPVPIRTDHTQQIQAYLHRGETLSERMDRETRRLESLFQEGLIPDPGRTKNFVDRVRSLTP